MNDYTGYAGKPKKVETILINHCKNCGSEGVQLPDQLMTECIERIMVIRSETLKEVGEWVENNAVIATEQKEVIPGKLSTSTATYGFHSKEWHELLNKLRKGEMPE